MPSVIYGALREVLERSLKSTQRALSDDTSRGTKRIFMIDLRNSQVGISRWSEVGGGGIPPPPSGVKVIQHRQKAKSAKNFDFERMKNFLKVDGLGKFFKSTIQSGYLGRYLLGPREDLERYLRYR